MQQRQHADSATLESGRRSKPGKQLKSVFKSVCDRLHLKPFVPYIIIIAYSIFGGIIFYALEKDNEVAAIVERKTRIEDARRDCFEQLKRMVWLASAVPNWDSTVYMAEVLAKYEESIGFSFSEEPKWSFLNGVFYAGTIYTTIAIIGIPLALATLNDLGNALLKLTKRITDALSSALVCCRRFVLAKKIGARPAAPVRRYPSRLVFTPDGEIVQEVELLHDVEPEQKASDVSGAADTNKRLEIAHKESDDKPPVLAAIVATVGWLFISAGIFCMWEANWSYWTSFYFFFVSMSTIGFGDVVPDRPDRYNGLYMIMNFGLVFAGLSLLTVCINVVQAGLADMYMQLLQRIVNEYMDQLAKGQGATSASLGMMDLFKRDPKARLLLALLSKDKLQAIMQKFQVQAKAQGIELPSILQQVDPSSGLPAILKAETMEDAEAIVEQHHDQEVEEAHLLQQQQQRLHDDAATQATPVGDNVGIQTDDVGILSSPPAASDSVGVQASIVLNDASSQAEAETAVRETEVQTPTCELRDTLSQTDDVDAHDVKKPVKLHEVESQTTSSGVSDVTESGQQTRLSWFQRDDSGSQTRATPMNERGSQTSDVQRDVEDAWTQYVRKASDVYTQTDELFAVVNTIMARKASRGVRNARQPDSDDESSRHDADERRRRRDDEVEVGWNPFDGRQEKQKPVKTLKAKFERRSGSPTGPALGHRKRTRSSESTDRRPFDQEPKNK